LANLPEVDTVDKRKAFLGFIGFTFLGIYLNWEGSSIVFSSRLVEELSRRGQPTMVQFLDNLLSAPQMGQDRKPRATNLSGAVKALDSTEWERVFGVPTTAPAPGRGPDLEMLALTVVSTVLVPYFKDTGAAKSQAAGQVAARLEQALTADPTALALWTPFKQSPEALELAMVPIVKAKMAQDQGLSEELALLVMAATKVLMERQPGEVDVTQRIRLVQGNVLGVAIGSDVINGIIRVCQEIDTVGPEANVKAVTIGSLGQ
jgi:hypothetical protein